MLQTKIFHFLLGFRSKVVWKKVIIATSLLFLFGCGQTKFLPVEPTYKSGNGGVNTVINTVKPALVTRATGCIMCHGHFSSNIITDFGYGGDGKGLNYFFGGVPGQSLPSGLYNRSGGSIYGDFDHTSNAPNWITAKFESGTQVVVPKAPTKGLDVLESSLFEYLANILKGGPTPLNVSVQEVKSMFIGAPTAQRILNASGVTQGSMRYYPTSASGTLSGLALDSSGRYYKNSGTIVCDGDVIIDGVVWLNQPVVHTQRGCRIYSTKSVFVSAPLKFEGGSQDANLQISSSRLVSLGLGHNTCNNPKNFDSLEYRLTYSINSWYKGFFTRNLGTPEEMFRLLKADGEIVGPTIPEAICSPGGRANGFDHLLINAPVVHSRYQGRFNGVIISEITLLSLATTDYVFDPVFLRVPILPVLSNSDFLTVEN